ncbi:MAG: hypothetical protein AAF197_12035 [Pseudomonadota bacterium]
MTAISGQWDGGPYTYPRDRIFEYTSDLLKERFGSLEGKALEELISLPCLFAYERNETANAHIGTITSVRVRGADVRIEYAFDPNLPPITATQIRDLVWEFDIGDWEFNRTHWAIKDADLFQELIDKDFLTQQQVAASHIARPAIAAPPAPVPIEPTIFRIPETGLETDLVSVMRPFDGAFDNVQAAIEATCKEIGLQCLDVNQVWDESEIIQDIFSLIYRSRVVICDFSHKNPNVFYEAGIAHTLGKVVVPIVQDRDDVPFDVRHHRYVKYDNSPDGLTQLSRDIEPRLRGLFQLS